LLGFRCGFFSGNGWVGSTDLGFGLQSEWIPKRWRLGVVT
jgi:hypothetical protein